MSSEKNAAARPPATLRLPGGTRTMTAANTVTDAAMEWPDGNDAPLVATRDPGGLARPYAAFSGPIRISDSSTAAANAARCHHWRRKAR